MSAQENHISLDGPMRRILAANQAQGESCPSPEIFAAYFEQALDPEETARYDAHFASCPTCRETLAGIARASVGATPLVHEASESRWNWKHMRLWLVPAAAGAMALLIFAVLYQRSITAPQRNAESASSHVAAPADNAASNLEARVTPSPPTSAPPPAQLQALPATSPEKKSSARQPPAAANAPTRNESRAAKRALDKEIDAAVSAVPPPPDSASQSASAASESVEVTEAAPVAEAAPAPSIHAKSSASLQQRAAAPRRMTGAAAGVMSRSAAKAPDHLVVTSPDSSISWTIHTNHVQYTENGQPAPVQDFLPTNNPIIAGSAPGGKVCWLVGRSGAVVLTTDGRLWLSANSPTTADLSKVIAKNAKVATVTTTDGHAYDTTDGGQTWKPQN